MSATADLTQPERVSFSSSFPRQQNAPSRSRKAVDSETSGQTDVVHNKLNSQRIAHDAALGQALMNAADPNVQNQIYQQQSLAMQQAVAQSAGLSQIAERAALTRIAEQTVLMHLADRTLSDKARKERAKRYATNEHGGRAPGKSIEAADTGGAAIS